MTSNLALQWLPCQAPGVIGSVLGQAGPVSVYCDRVRWKVWFAASISVWQHVKLSRSVPEIHSHVAGTLSNQQQTTNKPELSTQIRWVDFVSNCNMSYISPRLTNPPTQERCSKSVSVRRSICFSCDSILNMNM